MHLSQELRALAASFADAAEHRVARVLVTDVPDELHDHEGLADAGPTEDGGLAALLERADEIDDLDPGLEDLSRGRLVDESGRRPMDRIATDSLHGPLAVDRLADDVEEAAQRLWADRNGDGLAGRDDLHPAAQAVARVHRDRAHPVVAEVLLHFGDHEPAVLALHAERVVDLGKLALGEGDVEHRSDDLDDVPGRLRAALLRRRFRLDCHLFTPC